MVEWSVVCTLNMAQVWSYNNCTGKKTLWWFRWIPLHFNMQERAVHPKALKWAKQPLLRRWQWRFLKFTYGGLCKTNDPLPRSFWPQQCSELLTISEEAYSLFVKCLFLSSVKGVWLQWNSFYQSSFTHMGGSVQIWKYMYWKLL